MPGGDPLPVDTLAARLRARISPLSRPLPFPTAPTPPGMEAIRGELKALREQVQGYREQESERRGAWTVTKAWSERLLLAGGGYALAKILELVK